MSGLIVKNKNHCRLRPPFSASDLKNLSRFVFGSSRFNADEFGRFMSVYGPVVATTSGQGAVWIIGDRQMRTADDFRTVMQTLPVRNQPFTGDVYMPLNVLGQRQFLIVPFKSDELLWFRTEQELISYYKTRDIEPAVEQMQLKPSSLLGSYEFAK
ncbi:hypothetical protein YOLOSWAG_200 [Erwinia phage vB_EamM_Yoloswag]|uniref:Uncharacterized protein n=1 Tax=Erwinia phage vB_EamM_Yoloswag TaxID=1958956 RepID=A0A1S6L3B9_9CAUD|nr:hypothetical protein HOR66_gp200 [Erwinia phage vB_EamM_Yoloswag]AQT28678.1 hypothetical protein YOLOSWAG_200 [Erwinia phage vB_EamM_Yoloswag]